MQSSDAQEIEIERIVRDHHRGLGRYLRFLGCPRDRIDDVLHDTFLAVLLRRPEDRGEAAMRRYLKTAARNAYITQLRRARKDTEIAMIARSEKAVNDDPREDEKIAALRACLDDLAPRTRRAIDMQYGPESGREAIGIAVGLSIEGVKTLLRRAREALRACIEKRIGS